MIKAIVNNQVQTSFLALEQLCDGSSNSIVQCLKDIMEKHGLNMSNLAALGSDGASAMVGIHNGVSAQLKREQPTLISVHCVAHRLSLAVTQAAKLVSPVERFKNHLNSLFVYFHGSPNFQGKLQATFEALFENESGLKFKKPADTRWLKLACDEAVQVLKKILTSLSVTLQDIASSDSSDATALGLCSLLGKYEFIAGVFFMSEIMPVLSRLSKTFQEKNLNFGSVKPSILKATKAITNLRIQSESGKADWQNELTEWETEFDGSLQGCNEARFLATFVAPFIAAIQNNLSDRFPPADVDVLAAGEVFEPSKIPSGVTHMVGIRLQAWLNTSC